MKKSVACTIVIVFACQLYGSDDPWNGRSDHLSKRIGACPEDIYIPVPVGTLDEGRQKSLDSSEMLSAPDRKTRETCFFVGAVACFACYKLIPLLEKTISTMGVGKE